MKTSNLIDEFLAIKRFAMVGVSRNPREFSRKLLDEFTANGYDVIPVNPGAVVIENKRCYSRLEDITPPVTSALLMTPRLVSDRVLLECANAGITLVWIYGISGERDISPNARLIGNEHGIRIVPGYCPLMFLQGGAFFHKVHAVVWKFMGRYPA
jgi:predicted CoA-binding protein